MLMIKMKCAYRIKYVDMYDDAILLDFPRSLHLHLHRCRTTGLIYRGCLSILRLSTDASDLCATHYSTTYVSVLFYVLYF